MNLFFANSMLGLATPMLLGFGIGDVVDAAKDAAIREIRGESQPSLTMDEETQGAGVATFDHPQLPTVVGDFSEFSQTQNRKASLGTGKAIIAAEIVAYMDERGYRRTERYGGYAWIGKAPDPRANNANGVNIQRRMGSMKAMDTHTVYLYKADGTSVTDPSDAVATIKVETWNGYDLVNPENNTEIKDAQFQEVREFLNWYSTIRYGSAAEELLGSVVGTIQSESPSRRALVKEICITNPLPCRGGGEKEQRLAIEGYPSSFVLNTSKYGTVYATGEYNPQTTQGFDTVPESGMLHSIEF